MIYILYSREKNEGIIFTPAAIDQQGIGPAVFMKHTSALPGDNRDFGYEWRIFENLEALDKTFNVQEDSSAKKGEEFYRRFAESNSYSIEELRTAFRLAKAAGLLTLEYPYYQL